MADAGDLKAYPSRRSAPSTRNHVAESPEKEPLCEATGQSRGDADPVEVALAAALDGATKAGEWSTVARIAGELEARRLARSAVVDLSVERKRRNGNT